GPPSDIFSLGATLYVMLTGKSAFRGSEPEKALRGEFPPPSEVNRDIPPALEKICLKAMAAEPGERYQSALELADGLGRWLSDKPGRAWHDPLTVRARRWLGRNWNYVVSAVTVLLMAVVSLGWCWMLYDAERRYEEQSQREQRQRHQAEEQA